MTSVTILYQGHGGTDYYMDDLKIGKSWNQVASDLESGTSINGKGVDIQPLIYPNPTYVGRELNIMGPVKVFDIYGKLAIDFRSPKNALS